MADKFEVSGTIHWVGETENKSKDPDKVFNIRKFVLYQRYKSGKYTEIHTIEFQTTRHYCNMLDDISIGDRVTVFFKLKGREWKKGDKTMYFNTLEAVQIHVENINRKYLEDKASGRLWKRYIPPEDDDTDDSKEESNGTNDENTGSDPLDNFPSDDNSISNDLPF